MNTDVDLDNELLQLVVEELVRAGLRTPLREPILTAVESTSEERVEVVVPEGTGATAAVDETGGGTGAEGSAGSEGTEAESDATGKGPVSRAVRGLVVFAVLFAVLYATLRRLAGDDGA